MKNEIERKRESQKKTHTQSLTKLPLDSWNAHTLHLKLSLCTHTHTQYSEHLMSDECTFFRTRYVHKWLRA